MKKLITITLLSAFFIGCGPSAEEKQISRGLKVVSDRIKIIEAGYVYDIIEVDGVEYIANSRGGITPLIYN